jgi:hypothetical protein
MTCQCEAWWEFPGTGSPKALDDSTDVVVLDGEPSTGVRLDGVAGRALLATGRTPQPASAGFVSVAGSL